ncbi:NTP transferase domain-containing protein [archaeon]|jgi:NDP-mannose synthase|nr:NTP transferase domain-containing protein [archaeon]MBT3451339.1 NTP transferase domain-containing protein [archaeon]MBT6869345.1 NTP transferase domain-containing protein [archaeon]MBT7192508.1 NTP transferase domain-containing protein [archaeon]MBT7380584.1 NTP transferase domain-containing protein [archaeon]
MKAVIMAGGLGTRLKPFTHVLPKPLLPLGEHSVLEIVISKLRDHGFDEIFLTTYYKSNLFESYLGDGSKYGVKIIYSREENPLGTAGPLKLLDKHLNEPFLVINGDVLTNLNFRELMDFHIKNKSDFSLVTKKIDLPMDYGVVYSNENNEIHKIEEKPKLTKEINAGVYIINPSVIDFIPENQHMLMTDLLQELIIDPNIKLYKYLNEEYWLDMGQIKDYERAKNDFEEGKIIL